MAFYTFDQNNSGGSFVEDDQVGITQRVIVEAESADYADYRAERIGLYFDGAGDCSCCGDRWYSASEYDRTDVPSIYDQDVSSGEYTPGKYHMPWTEVAAYIHYLDGSVVPVHVI